MQIQIKQIILENKIDANQVRQIFNNHGNNAERIAAPLAAIPIIGGLAANGAQSVGGYQVGSKIGHPVAGIFLGRDGAVGAASKNVKGLSIKDVYTPKNILNKSLIAAGAIGGMYAGDELGDAITRSAYDNALPEAQNQITDLKDYDHKFMGNDALGDIQKIAVGSSLLIPTATPALRYGAGKLFGKKYNK